MFMFLDLTVLVGLESVLQLAYEFIYKAFDCLDVQEKLCLTSKNSFVFYC